jgi:hypothetical protein
MNAGNAVSQVMQRALPAAVRTGAPLAGTGGAVKMRLMQQTLLNGNIVLKDAKTGVVVGQMANQEQADRTKAYFKP